METRLVSPLHLPAINRTICGDQTPPTQLTVLLPTSFVPQLTGIFYKRQQFVHQRYLRTSGLPSKSLSPTFFHTNAKATAKLSAETALETPLIAHDIKESLLELRNGVTDSSESTFPATLSKKERLLAHEWAEKFGLSHVSKGQGKERQLIATRLSVKERLERFKELIDLEEEASAKAASPGDSWRQLEADGLLLRGAVLLEREAAAFGKERWVIGENADASKKGHVAKFGQRARPGAAVRLALREENAAGGWAVAENEPPGRVAWCRSGRMCIVFDRPPGGDTEGEDRPPQKGGLDFLLVPDRVTFDRLRTGINDCIRAEGPMARFLDALLGVSLQTSKSSDLKERLESNGSASTSNLSRPMGSSNGQEEFLDTGLNDEQRSAVMLCVNGPEDGGASPVAVLHGPFGTGKTRTLVEVVRQRVKAGQRVLVAAASNAAVDNVATALLAADPKLAIARAGVPERVSPLLASHTLEWLQDQRPESAMAARLRKEAFAAVTASHKWTRAADGGQRRREARKEAAALFRDARKLEKQAVTAVLRDTKVLCGTLTGFSGSLYEVNDDELRKFDCALVDEASQAVTPALLLLLPFLKYPANMDLSVNGPLLVLAGDHRQLPPTVISEKANEMGGGLGATLFEELMERDGGGLGSSLGLLSGDENMTEVLNRARNALSSDGTALDNRRTFKGRFSAALRVQYRMPRALMAFPSAAFYGGELRAGAPTLEREPLTSVNQGFTLLRDGCWLEVIDTAGAGFDEEKRGEGGKASDFSTSNPGQAELTARIVRELVGSGSCGPSDIGVLTPYSAQVALLRDLLASDFAAGVEIDSVDGFQGREKTAIVFDCVRSNSCGEVGFLADQRRLNVAISRARQKLVIVGDSATLGADTIWAALFDWAGELQNPSSACAYRSFFELPPADGW